MRRYHWRFFIILILGILMSGCRTIYKSAVDERSMGVQYSDQSITMSIRQKFSEDEKIKYFDISTYVYYGHVYLVGEYEAADQKSQAVKLAGQVEGVKSVTDYFLPKKNVDTCGSMNNVELLATVKKDLISDMDLSSTQIEVKALQCNIVLLGLVGSANDIKKATTHAKNVEGVRSVKSFLKVKK